MENVHMEKLVYLFIYLAIYKLLFELTRLKSPPFLSLSLLVSFSKAG